MKKLVCFCLFLVHGLVGPGHGQALSKIAFVSDRDGNTEIYTMDPDGSEPTNVTNNPGSDTSPSWAPDGSRIAFVSDRDGNAEIYSVNLDGTDSVNLTQRESEDRDPVWSPNGSLIAFVSHRDGVSNVFTVAVDGSGLNNLTAGGVQSITGAPAWSPDGTRLALAADADIYTVNTDGTGLVNLTQDGARDRSPAWSPDGDRIAFVSDRGRKTVETAAGRDAVSNWDVFAMGADGSDLVNRSYSRYHESAPVWSPDGTRMIFRSSAPAFSSRKKDSVRSSCSV